MPGAVRLHFGLSIVGMLGAAAAVIGRWTGSDPLIASGMLGGALLLIAGLAMRFNYRDSASEYEEWIRSRGHASPEGAVRRMGLGYIFAGAVLTISAAVGLWIY